jgi:nucleoside phosphorylase
LDNPVPVTVPDDPFPYLMGTLPSRVTAQPHVVAVALQTNDGTRDAAWLCAHMPRTFKRLRTFAMCGIAGGVPSSEPGKGVELGDIVVATEVVDYRHERLVDGSHKIRATPQRPGSVWMNADHEIQVEELNGEPPWLAELEVKSRDDPFWRPAAGRSTVHRAPVGSADLLVRDRVFRDGLHRDYRVLAFEMEGAGIAIGSHLGDHSWYMVRGIADYGDNATKNDDWHAYASLAAATYLRSVLAKCAPLVTAPAPPEPAQPGTRDPLDTMTNALVGLPIMVDETQRRAVINQLRTGIRSQIRENPLPQLHIIEIVTACQQFPDGLDQLSGALGRSMGRDSAKFLEVERILRENWSRQ